VVRHGDGANQEIGVPRKILPPGRRRYESNPGHGCRPKGTALQRRYGAATEPIGRLAFPGGTTKGAEGSKSAPLTPKGAAPGKSTS
jgi:hypothetical protein